jgi:hypothetical protein
MKRRTFLWLVALAGCALAPAPLRRLYLPLVIVAPAATGWALGVAGQSELGVTTRLE